MACKTRRLDLQPNRNVIIVSGTGGLGGKPESGTKDLANQRRI